MGERMGEAGDGCPKCKYPVRPELVVEHEGPWYTTKVYQCSQCKAIFAERDEI